MAPRRLTGLGELARLFAFLGAVGVGGPAAHIALMHDHVVRRRRWMTDEEFASLVGATALIPGPNSTEMAIAIGQRRGGWRGLLLAGACFILPAVVIVGVLAALYEAHGTTPTVDRLRYGVVPVVVAIVGVALVRLVPSVTRTALDAVALAAGVALALAGVHELVVVVAVGVGLAIASLVVRPSTPVVVAVALLAAPPGFWRIVGVFAQIGSVIYGSGYVLLAFLDSYLVQDRGWITSQVLLDAVAIGQVTPGPVFSTATFVGWQVAGWSGAAAATLGIFAPSFVFVALLDRVMRLTESSALARAFLRGVTAASIGLMIVVLGRLAVEGLGDLAGVAVVVASAVLLLRTRLNSVWLIAAGVAFGLAVG